MLIRGIERRKIFLNDEDREDMLDLLAKLLPETETACYVWVFIANHAHFFSDGHSSPFYLKEDSGRRLRREASCVSGQ